jgi:hypothetical protein
MLRYIARLIVVQRGQRCGTGVSIQIYRGKHGPTLRSLSLTSSPTFSRHYSYDDSLAPWLAPNHDFVDNVPGDFEVGWMMESLVIDPFDSNHWLYGTGATIYGGHDLLRVRIVSHTTGASQLKVVQWDTAYNVTIKSLADGIEETAVLGLISPPGGPPLLSAVGDLGGKWLCRLSFPDIFAHLVRFYPQLLDHAPCVGLCKSYIFILFGH